MGGSKAGGLPHPSLSLSLPFPFPLSFQTNQWEGRSDPVRGKFPRFPSTTTTVLTNIQHCQSDAIRSLQSTAIPRLVGCSVT